MSSGDCCFYLGLAKPISSNLVQRLSDEMVDLGVSIKQKMFKAISFRFNTPPLEEEFLEIPNEENIPLPVGLSNDNMPMETVQRYHDRPLPLPPIAEEVDDVSECPWYHIVDRREGENLVQSGIDGSFLVRPSSKGRTFLTLTLWYNNRVYNIPIRQRQDGLWSLGTPKQNERNFRTIQDMVLYYQTEEILLFSKGVETGQTILTIYPP